MRISIQTVPLRAHKMNPVIKLLINEDAINIGKEPANGYSINPDKIPPIKPTTAPNKPPV